MTAPFASLKEVPTASGYNFRAVAQTSLPWLVSSLPLSIEMPKQEAMNPTKNSTTRFLHHLLLPADDQVFELGSRLLRLVSREAIVRLQLPNNLLPQQQGMSPRALSQLNLRDQQQLVARLRRLQAKRVTVTFFRFLQRPLRSSEIRSSQMGLQTIPTCQRIQLLLETGPIGSAVGHLIVRRPELSKCNKGPTMARMTFNCLKSRGALEKRLYLLASPSRVISPIAEGVLTLMPLGTFSTLYSDLVFTNKSSSFSSLSVRSPLSLQLIYLLLV